MRASTVVKLGIGKGELGNCVGKKGNRACDETGLEVGSSFEGLRPKEEWGFLDTLVNGFATKREVGPEDGFLDQPKLKNDTDAASRHKLKLNSIISDDKAVTFASEGKISRASNVKMEDGAGGLFGAQSQGKVGRDRDHVAVNERRPNVDLLVTLVSGRECSAGCDLLVPVCGVDVEPVIVDADSVVGVPGRHRDLETGSEEIGDGGVEAVYGGVLEDEPGLVGTEDGPNDEDCDKNNQEEDENAGYDSSE
ncbi:hypothetical protein V6N11_028175 [Hibiscus sabdariffa]|uniref:Uncharacterized protein n=1 Tax=Hibiscus sabdariffa TaxID=183260 RepID=A0ABR1Z7Y3_9ROSI